LVPPWIATLRPNGVEWRTFSTKGGLLIDAWAVTVRLPSYQGQRYDTLPWDCRKKGGLVAAADQDISCAEVEVTKRLRAAGFSDAGWLATCGQRLWAPYQRPRGAIRDETESRFPGRSHRLVVNGAGTPDVVSLHGPHPVFVECKGTEKLQDNQAAWIRALLTPDEVRELFAVVLRVPQPGSWSRPADNEPRSVGAEIDERIASLFTEARGSSAADRIEFRDPIANFGPAAIKQALRELDRQPGSAFPLTVIEAVGRCGASASAANALRRVAMNHPDLRDLADAARGRLPTDARVTSMASRVPAIPIGDVPISGATPPRPVGFCDFLTARRQPCENLGRYPRGDYWACSAHATAGNPRPIEPRR